jgi:2-dehydropantoate 2-reductase
VIAILGPGGVGGFLAGALARAGEDVTVIAREETAAVIAREGVRVESVRLGDFTAHPAAATRLTEPRATLIVATKFTTLEPALERIDAEPALVVPLLNGLDHMPVLRERYGHDRVAAGSIRIEATRHSPGYITQTSPFLRVDIGPPAPAVEELAATLERAQVPARVTDEPQVLWGKLVRLNAIACLTSAYDLKAGPILADPQMRAELEACVREAVAVATAEGAEVTTERVMEELGAVHPTLGTSMQRDIAAGIPPELDAIPGAVLRAAARHGIQAPTIQRMYDRIAARIAG